MANEIITDKTTNLTEDEMTADETALGMPVEIADEMAVRTAVETTV